MEDKPKKKKPSYKKIKDLGEGAMGQVSLVECDLDGQLYAKKEIDCKHMDEEDRNASLNEARIMKALCHPNIVGYKECYKTKKSVLCIVMEYVDGGDLDGEIKKRAKTKDYFSEEEVLRMFTQISLALKHSHARRILHRDLKSQNVMCMKDGTIKLGDFGVGRILSDTKSKAQTVIGTPYYLSPEIILGKAYRFETDIWSLGILLYEICALK